MLLKVDIEKKRGDFSFEAVFSLATKKCGIFGPSGSGKSTLMHLLAGLLKPDRGRIVLGGTTLFDSEEKINLSPRQRRVGVVFQQAHLFPHMNVERNLFYGWQRTSAEDRQGDPDEVIEALGLTHLLQRGVNNLSGGEKQRVALGRTVLACPHLILLDEPLNGLDQDLKFQIIPYLRRVLDQFDIPLLFISHSLQEIRLMTDEVMVFTDGRVVQSLPAEKLARQRLVSGRRGYANLLHLSLPRPQGDLWSYSWGKSKLILVEEAAGGEGETLFELGAKDITLFKENPVATSARNLLHCTVNDLFGDGNIVGVELDCQGQRLVSQIVPEAARELSLVKGSPVVAVIKASAFRRLY